MTADEVRQELSQVRYIDKRIYALQDAMRVAWDRETSVTAVTKEVHVQTSNQYRPGEKFAELASEAERQIEALNEAKRRALKLIGLTKDNRFASVLTMYYLECSNYERIAVEMGYSFRHVKRLHKKAIEDIAKRCP